MDVKLDQYRIFYRVAMNKSITAGAAELFLTQSAVSQAIKNLEDALGVELFIRGKRGVELTQEGEILLKYVGSALSLLEQACSQLGKVKALESGELRIGVGDTISRHLLLTALERFSRLHPKVELRILNRVSSETIELLRSGRVDLAFVNMPIDRSGVFLVGEIPVQDCFVAGKETAKKLIGSRMTYEEIARLPLILLEAKSSSRRFIDSCFGERGIVLRPEIELGAHDLLLDFAAANLGVACVVEEFSRKELESGKVIKLDTEAFPKRSVGIFTLRPHSAPAAEALLELLDI
ncbi:MAG: LysR family transcriptional regulator [Clostridiaceae bacterium]|nr:LysR family transcriptional regulator [Clostridiaceae bacterium]